MAMTKAKTAIPEGYHSVMPYLVVRGVDKLLDFLKDAFDAQEITRNTAEGREIVHAATRVGDSVIEMGDPGGTAWPLMPAAIHYYVKDADAAYQRALKAGAKSLYEPRQMDYGDREGGIQDPCGNDWYIATHLTGATYRPALFRDANPGASLKDAAAFLEFVSKAYAAEIIEKHADGAGVVGHAKVKLGDTVVEVSEAHGQWGPRPVALHYYSENSDQLFQQAVIAGAKVLQPMADQFYGDRGGSLLDAWGNHWYIARHTEDLTPEEIAERAAAAGGQ
jgi:PhnB protein